MAGYFYRWWGSGVAMRGKVLNALQQSIPDDVLQSSVDEQ